MLFFPFPSHSSSIFIEPFVRLGIFTLNDNELGLSVSFTCARTHSARWNWEKMDNLQIMSRSLSLNLSAKEPETFQLLLRSWNEMMKCIRVNLYFGLPLFYDIRKWKFVIFWCPRDLSCDLFMSSEHSPPCWSKEQKKKKTQQTSQNESYTRTLHIPRPILAFQLQILGNSAKYR